MCRHHKAWGLLTYGSRRAHDRCSHGLGVPRSVCVARRLEYQPCSAGVVLVGGDNIDTRSSKIVAPERAAGCWFEKRETRPAT